MKRHRNRTLAGLATAGAAVACSLAIVGSATAADPVVGTTTTLKPDKDTFEALSDNGITVVPTNGAAEEGKGIAFPITRGSLGNKTKIVHTGGIRFESDGDKLKVKDFVLKDKGDDDTALVKASTGEAKIELLDLDLSDAKFRELSDTTLLVKNIRASLTDLAAAALTDTFGQDIPAGTPIGKLIVEIEVPANQ